MEEEHEQQSQPIYENEYESGDEDIIEISPPIPTTAISLNAKVYNGPTKAPSQKAFLSSSTKVAYNGPTAVPSPSTYYGKASGHRTTTTVQTRNGAGLFGNSTGHETRSTVSSYPRESFLNSSAAGVKESHVGNVYGYMSRGVSSRSTNRQVPSLASAARSRSPGYSGISHRHRYFNFY